MAAAVTDAGQGIVFRKEGDFKDGLCRPGHDGPKSRLLARKVFFYGHAQAPAGIDIMLTGMKLFTGQLRIIGNGIIQLEGLFLMEIQGRFQSRNMVHNNEKLLLSDDKHI